MLSILDQVLTADELAEVLAHAADEAAFEDGRRTAGYRAKLVKNNEQMKRDSPGLPAARTLLAARLQAHPLWRNVTLARAVRPILISRYRPGMAYGLHVDDPLMGSGPTPKTRSDLALTLFLTPPESYQGGELYFESPWGAQELKLPAGSAVIYPASTLHRVNPVTEGERIAAVTWIESYVRDPAQRELLAELDRVRLHLHRQEPESEAAHLAFKSYANLLRMWSQT